MFNPTPAVAIGGGIAGGVFATRDFSSEDTIGDKAAQLGAGSVLGAMFAVGGYKTAKFAIGSGIGHHYANEGMSVANSYFAGLYRDVQRATIEAEKFSYIKDGVKKLGYGKAAMRFVGRRPMTMAGIGAGIGAVVGSKYDKPGTGAAVGAGVGAATSVAMKLAGSRMPFKGGLATVGIAAAVFTGGRMLQPTEFETQADASPDVTGYNYAARGSVASRITLMGATGDIALGLHNQRHG